MRFPDRLSTALAGRYRIERELGRGGTAVVYLARDLRHGREVAIKLLRADLYAALGPERFLREIKIAAQLQHPNILPLLDSGDADGLLFFVMPYIKGRSLRERLAREGALPVSEAVRLLLEIVDALAEAHVHGVVHRDMKPDNVMLSGRHALVADFGVAKAVSEATASNTITSAGIAVGTPTYMSPEQATADPHVDQRSDIYAVGVMAYEMLTGRPPFTAATLQEVLAAHVTGAVDPVSKHRASIPPALEQVVMRCLAKRPADRFQTAAELEAALEPLATPGNGITPADVAPLARARARRRWAIAAGAALVVVAAAVAVARRDRRPTAEPATLDRVRLTTSGHAYRPVVSPDGREVAYSENHCPSDSTPCSTRLIVQDVATGARQAISDSGDAIYPYGWSSSGAWMLVFLAPSGSHQRPQSYVMSHLGGAPVLLGGRAAFLPGGDTILAVPNDVLRGVRSITLSSYVAPWVQPVDSVAIAVPEGAIFIDAFANAPDGRWIAALWDIVGQENSVLTMIDRRGRQVASRAVPSAIWRLSWNASGTALLRPIQSHGQGGLERIAVTAGGAFGETDTILLSASSAPPDFSRSTDGAAAAYTESRTGESTVYTIEATTERVVPRLARRIVTDPAILDVFIAPNGTTIVYSALVTAGAGERRQFIATPYGGGPATPITPPLADVVSAVFSADSRRFVVASAMGGRRRRITAYDVARGGVTTSVERHDSLSWLVALSTGGVALVSPTQVVFADDSLREVRRVPLPDSLGRNVGPAAGVGPGVVLPFQPYDFSSTLQSDWNFHLPIFLVTPAGALERRGVLASWSLSRDWWLGDGAVWFVGITGTDPNLAMFRIPFDGRPQARIGRIPFHDIRSLDLSADGRRGAVVLQPRLTDIWLLRRFGPAMH